MNRRGFIAGVGAAAWPLTAPAQQPERMRRIGVLMWNDENSPQSKTYVSTIAQTLADLGWVDGRNVRMDFRWTGGDINRTRELAHALVGLQPDIILTGSTPVTAAAHQETSTIPIVFANVGDPVSSGFVAALNHPGGNMTGFALLEPSMGGKWLELLSEIMPGLKPVAVMLNPNTSVASLYMPSFETAARALKVEPKTALVHSDVEIEAAIIALGREPGAGLVVLPDLFLFRHRAPIILEAARNNVPAVYSISEYVRDGGLFSYGIDLLYSSRRAATYVDRILRGAKPGDLSVQFPEKYEMVLNLKTARALGLTVPQSILLRADEVIE
jgi:putative ABC transport system substrate-binding protein